MDETVRKHRSLRRYEADVHEMGARPGSGDMALFSPFGPLIGRCAVDAALIDHLNRFGDGVVRPDRSSEFMVPREVAAKAMSATSPSLLSFLSDAIHHYVMASERFAPASIRIDRIWMVSQYAGSPSPVHFHSSDLSGVLYLKAPPDQTAGELAKTYISGRQAGFINFMDGGRREFSKSIVSFPPEAGTFYIFPAWLLHGAEPFLGAGERRSLSFNARVTIED